MTATQRNKRFEELYEFHCRSLGLPRFVTQFSYANSLHPMNKRRRHRADVCFPDYRLLIEIDGGIWMKGGGAHSHPIDIVRNMRKQNDALLWGYSILRFSTTEVTNYHAIGFTQKVLFAKGWRTNQSQSLAVS